MPVYYTLSTELHCILPRTNPLASAAALRPYCTTLLVICLLTVRRWHSQRKAGPHYSRGQLTHNVLGCFIFPFPLMRRPFNPSSSARWCRRAKAGDAGKQHLYIDTMRCDANKRNCTSSSTGFPRILSPPAVPISFLYG